MPIQFRLNPLNAALLIALGTHAQAATFDIDSCDASALIDTIDAANSNGQTDVINLNGGCTYTLMTINNEIEGDNGLPSVTSTITINGNGATIERSNAPDTPPFRLMHIAESGDLTLSQVTMQNGWAIDSIPNSYDDRSEGGGFFNRGVVTLTSSTISGNTADRGGGFYNPSGTVTLTNSTLTSNSARQGGGFHSSTPFVTINAVVTINNSSLLNNMAYQDGGGFVNRGIVTLANSTISGNSITGRNGGTSVGGGGFKTVIGPVTLTNSIISGNFALVGGGFRNSSSSMVTLTNSIISGNSAELYGGGFFNHGDVVVSGEEPGISTAVMTQNTVSGNSAGISGGGFENFGTVKLTNSTVSGNIAAEGGGIKNTAFGPVATINGVIDVFATLVLTNSTLADNTALLGGGIYNGAQKYSRDVEPKNTIEIRNTLMARNPGGNCVGEALISTVSSLFDDSTCNGITTSDIGLGSDLVTLTLANSNLNFAAQFINSTSFYLLLPNSAAIDAGDNSFCIESLIPGFIGGVNGVDQRGYKRDNQCDIGSIEFGASEIQATLESPTLGSFESGVGLIRGWVCDAERVEISIDAGPLRPAAYGTKRGDTVEVCGDDNNGFGLVFNWNSLSGGLHNLRALVDGAEFANVTFTTTTLGTDFLTGVSAEYPLPDFPTSGNTVTIGWAEAHQNFVFVSPVTIPDNPNPPSLPGTRLESPTQGSFESGVGLIRGWVCDAERVEISIDDGPLRPAAYGTKRGDTIEACGDDNNGFGLTFNWNNLDNGVHTVRAFANGVVFADVNFAVTNLGVDFLTGVSAERTLPDFPEAGTTTTVRWAEPHQNFIIAP